jgi:hypothetical protein
MTAHDHMKLGTAMLWSIAKALSRFGAPWAFGFAEHVMGIWGGELYPDAEAGAHLASGSIFKHRVRVEFYDRCEHARLGVMACMQVFYVL